MKMIDQSWSWEWKPDPKEALARIERATRTCYKSEENMDDITPEQSEAFLDGVMDRGHLSVIEHSDASVRIITNRGVTHELVRHRLAAYSQESTRYCNYSKSKFGQELTFIKPVWWKDGVKPHDPQNIFLKSLENDEENYLALIDYGWSPQQAREILPNALKTEIVMSCNFREWNHVFNLRCSKAAHPQIKAIMLDMLKEFAKLYTPIFDSVAWKYDCGGKAPKDSKITYSKKQIEYAIRKSELNSSDHPKYDVCRIEDFWKKLKKIT
jgi:thymidylate synthase (FAD)